MRLKNKIGIVTGAATGIGKAIATRFVAEGARVAVADIEFDNAQKTSAQIGSAAIALKVDVSESNSVENMVAEVQKQLGPIDILVNNAGISEIVPFLELQEETWDKHININLKGAFLCSQIVLKSMAKRKCGKIINMSSQSGKKGSSCYQAYCASKFGIIGLTQSTAAEFASLGININAICPGFVMTALWDKMLPEYAAKRNMTVDEVKNYLLSRIPMGRFCTPQDIAAVACFLASDDSDYLTGQAINVTGGMIMH